MVAPHSAGDPVGFGGTGILLVGLVVVGGLGAYESSEHFARRIDGFLTPDIDPRTQLGYATNAIQEGGFFGVGVGAGDEGDMAHAAYTPTLDWLRQHSLYTQLKAHGTAVGLPSDGDMGNSEVGHLNIGAGRIVYQGLLGIDVAVPDGSFVESDAFVAVMAKVNALLAETTPA